MHILIGIIGIIFFLALAFLFSSDRKNIRWKYVGILLAIQLIFAFILLKLQWESRLLVVFQTVFNYLLLKAADGVNFVFGEILYIDPKQPPSSSVYYYLSYLFQRLSVSFNTQRFYL